MNKKNLWVCVNKKLTHRIGIPQRCPPSILWGTTSVSWDAVIRIRLSMPFCSARLWSTHVFLDIKNSVSWTHKDESLHVYLPYYKCILVYHIERQLDLTLGRGGVTRLTLSGTGITKITFDGCKVRVPVPCEYVLWIWYCEVWHVWLCTSKIITVTVFLTLKILWAELTKTTPCMCTNRITNRYLYITINGRLTYKLGCGGVTRLTLSGAGIMKITVDGRKVWVPVPCEDVLWIWYCEVWHVWLCTCKIITVISKMKKLRMTCHNYIDLW